MGIETADLDRLLVGAHVEIEIFERNVGVPDPHPLDSALGAPARPREAHEARALESPGRQIVRDETMGHQGKGLASLQNEPEIGPARRRLPAHNPERTGATRRDRAASQT